MKAFELYTKEGKQTGVFCCGECKIVHRTQKDAESCCVCADCGVNTRLEYKTVCGDCSKKRYAKQQAEAIQKEVEILNKAVEVTEWQYVWFNEKMYSDLESLIDDCGIEENVIPEFVHLMKPIMFTGFQIDRLLDEYTENIMVDDIDSNEVERLLIGYAELKKAVCKFNDSNKSIIIYWVVDNSKKVRIKV